jgi:hypothetical protein
LDGNYAQTSEIERSKPQKNKCEGELKRTKHSRENWEAEERSPPVDRARPRHQFPVSVKKGKQSDNPDRVIGHLTMERGGNVHNHKVIERRVCLLTATERR